MSSPDERCRPVDLTDPTTAALVAVEAAERTGRGYALYGGLLLAAYGEPRETRDVDLAVTSLDADAIRAALDAMGVRTGANFEGVTFGGLVLDRVNVIGGDDLGLNTIDLVRPASDRYAADALDRSIEAPLRDRSVRVLSPEDFVLFKLLSTRDRDLDDAVSVLRRSGGQVDREGLNREVERLAGELPAVAIRDRYDRLWKVASLSQRRKPS